VRRLVILDERWDSALTDLGVKIAVVLSGERACAVLPGSPAEARCRQAGLPVFHIEDPRRRPLAGFLSTGKVLSGFSPDAVLTVRGDETLFCAALKPLYRFRLFRLHGEAKGVRNSTANRLFHEKFVDGVILSSRKFLCPAVAGVRKVVVHGAVDTEKFRFYKEGRERFRRHFGLQDTPLIGVFGRLDPVKGHALFIRALSLLKRRGFKFRALVVGLEKGVKVAELASLAETAGLKGDVIFITGRRTDIPELMSAVDVGVVPSVGSEVIARVLLELMACARPVVVTSVGVLPEVVSKAFGTVVEPSPSALADGLAEVLLRDTEGMGKRAREEACEKYSLRALARTVDRFLA